MTATPVKLKQWKYLEDIIDKVSKRDDTSVGLLIGVDCTNALDPLNIILSCDIGPCDVICGWTTLTSQHLLENDHKRQQICQKRHEKC